VSHLRKEHFADFAVDTLETKRDKDNLLKLKQLKKGTMLLLTIFYLLKKREEEITGIQPELEKKKSQKPKKSN